MADMQAAGSHIVYVSAAMLVCLPDVHETDPSFVLVEILFANQKWKAPPVALAANTCGIHVQCMQAATWPSNIFNEFAPS